MSSAPPSKKKTIRLSVLFCVCSASLLGPKAAAESGASGGAPAVKETSGLAAKLVSLRREVETLNERQLDQRREDRERLAALRRERDTLAQRLRMAKVRRATLVKVADRRRRQAQTIEREVVDWLAPARQSLLLTRRFVQRSLPFRREERLAALQRIEGRLLGSHPDPAQALTRLWRFIEEEAALAEDIGLSQQTISLRGRRLLVEVARVGMALLYFKTAQGEVGWAVEEGGSWRFQVVEGRAAGGAIREFFDLLRKNRGYGLCRLLIPPPRSIAEAVRNTPSSTMKNPDQASAVQTTDGTHTQGGRQ